ncbi:hypothetical protein PCIT_a3027 [Pseudoalteromonas citrea]|uniref:Structural protein P5 n=2 Tax=Pseudoalteromonas citrea TaxID=43655 RepID=A0AAD4AI33_9GAMM|nr:hypothetical protein [Pseudoalteromonas citrea]KAF7770074.1 hypothetical protein PCIT_a3027 [Pseudoalteromonas citrea]
MTRQNLNVRNNNPLNIRENGTQWEGKTGHNKGFVKFESVEMGFRAAYKTLMTYRNNYGLDSISDIISRWAPDSENHTENYIAYIRQKMNIEPNAFNFWSDTVPDERYPELMLHMANMEGAKGAFSIEQAERGVALA